MLVKTVKVSEKGQIAIPVDIRLAAGISQGDELLIMEDAGKLLLQRAEGLSSRVRDDFKDMLGQSESAMKKVWDNKEDDSWNAPRKSPRVRRKP